MEWLGVTLRTPSQMWLRSSTLWMPPKVIASRILLVEVAYIANGDQMRNESKRAAVLALAASMLFVVGCATSYDKPEISYNQSPDGKGRLHAWSSGSAAAIGMPNDSPTDPSVCVLGAAFARTGTSNGGVSLVLPGEKSLDATSESTAGALLLKNPGQTATYLDAGMFHLCMMYAQAWIKEEESRVRLLEKLFLASVEVSKNSIQFAPTASLQPDSKTNSAAAKPTQPSSAASAPAAAASAPSAAASAPSAAASATASTKSTPSSASTRRRDLNDRIQQNTAPGQ